MSDIFAHKEIRKKLRQEILLQRRKVTPQESYEAGLAVCEELKRHPIFKNRVMAGSYLSMGGELSTAPVNEFLVKEHDLALPFMNVHKRGHMNFYGYKEGDELIENRYHILEPEPLDENIVTADKFDLLVVPLVGFDEKGNRMGMGGGYYDRMLKKVSATCLIIGVAYEFQKVKKIPIENWDMPLNEVITPEHHYVFS